MHLNLFDLLLSQESNALTYYHFWFCSNVCFHSAIHSFILLIEVKVNILIKKLLFTLLGMTTCLLYLQDTAMIITFTNF